MSTGREIRLIENESGRWTARDLDRGLTTQGETRDEALESLDAVIAAIDEDTGREPTAEDLRDAGIDPADNTTGDGELPDVLK